jgi:hypothetical protein
MGIFSNWQKKKGTFVKVDFSPVIIDKSSIEAIAYNKRGF